MARPQKIGIDFFYTDVHIDSDIKIQRLMRHKSGGKALAVYIILLTRIYTTGYYLSWDEDTCFVFSKILDFDEEYIQDVVTYSVEIGLFDKEFFEKDKVLTSRSIQRRYIVATLRRKTNYSKLPYFFKDLLDSSKLMSTETELMSTETELMSTETELMLTESTQIKENKIKENNISSISPARTRGVDEDAPLVDETEALSPVEKLRAVNKTISTSEGFNVIINDRRYLLRLQAVIRMSIDEIIAWAFQFNLKWKQQHENMDELCKHFEYTLQKKANSGEIPLKKMVVTNKIQAKQAWLQISALLALRKPELEDVLGSLSFHRFQNNIIQLVAATEEEARNAKTLLPLLEEFSLEVCSGKIMFSFGVKNSKI